MKRLLFAVPLVLLASLLWFGCDLLGGTGGTGGAGADFDASLYYTKTEIDSRHYTKTEADAMKQLLTGGGSPPTISISAVGTGNGQPLTAPASVGGAIVRVRITNTSASAAKVVVKVTDAVAGSGSPVITMDLVPGGEVEIPAAIKVFFEGTTWKFFLDETYTSAGWTGVVQVTPVTWLKDM